MLLELLHSSWVMYPLFGASILALAIILERLCILNFTLKRATKRVLNYGQQNLSQDKTKIKKRMLHQAKHEIFLWEKHLNMLGTIATTTPLLGLLGTVLGMIKIFDVMMHDGLGQAQELAGGISEALLTTAVGMSIAIIALLFHRYFNRKINGLILSLEAAILEWMDYAKN
jgi:biopolymer transport protein ExbB